MVDDNMGPGIFVACTPFHPLADSIDPILYTTGPVQSEQSEHDFPAVDQKVDEHGIPHDSTRL